MSEKPQFQVAHPLEELPKTQEALSEWFRQEFAPYWGEDSLNKILKEQQELWQKHSRQDSKGMPRLAALQFPFINTIGHLMERCKNPDLHKWVYGTRVTSYDGTLDGIPNFGISYWDSPLEYKPEFGTIPLATATFVEKDGELQVGRFRVNDSIFKRAVEKLFTQVVEPALANEREAALPHIQRSVGVVDPVIAGGDCGDLLSIRRDDLVL